MRQTLKITFLLGMAFLFFFLLTDTSWAAMATHNYNNPVSEQSFSLVLQNLLVAIQGVVGWIAVMMIVVGGLIYITSGGSVQQTTLGKAIIVYAMVGFAIAVAAPSLLKEIKDIVSAGTVPGPNLLATATPVATIIANVMDFLLTAIGMLSVIGFITGGVLYISAGGDAQKADRAKMAVFYSIVAISISGAALIILRQVIQILEA